MISLFRDFTKSWIFTALMALLIASFAVFGLRDVFGSAGLNSVVTAGDRKVTSQQFKTQFDNYKTQQAQRYRLGVNHHQIPVNAPKCPFHSYHRDGQMRTDGNAGSTLGYEPNSYGQWQEQPDFSEPPLALQGSAGHWDHREDQDYFSQPGALFRLMTFEQQQALFDNTARSIQGASAQTKQRHIDNCSKADPAYGAGVASAIERLGQG